jgi:hypothetical protein
VTASDKIKLTLISNYIKLYPNNKFINALPKLEELDEVYENLFEWDDSFYER